MQSIFCKYWSDVIKIAIVSNSTSNCNLITHFSGNITHYDYLYLVKMELVTPPNTAGDNIDAGQ